MSKKTKNKNKQLLAKIHKQAEDFSRGEEIANFVSHTVGAGLAIIAFIILIIRASWTRDVGTIIYGIWKRTYCSLYNVFNLSRIKAWNS